MIVIKSKTDDNSAFALLQHFKKMRVEMIDIIDDYRQDSQKYTNGYERDLFLTHQYVLVMIDEGLVMDEMALYYMETIRKLCRKQYIKTYFIVSGFDISQMPARWKWIMAKDLSVIDSMADAYLFCLYTANEMLRSRFKQWGGYSGNLTRSLNALADRAKDSKEYICGLAEKYMRLDRSDIKGRVVMLHTMCICINGDGIQDLEKTYVYGIADYIMYYAGTLMNYCNIEVENMEMCFLLAIKQVTLYNCYA